MTISTERLDDDAAEAAWIEMLLHMIRGTDVSRKAFDAALRKYVSASRSAGAERREAELAETVARYGNALRSMQEAAALAIVTVPSDQQQGTVGDFLAAIHRHCASALSDGHGGNFETSALKENSNAA